jgi:anti-anti-sigma regulatory factor
MLRITENLENPQAVRLKLDGILDAENYHEFEHVFFRYHTGAATTIVLDMQGVTFLHDDAARKLSRVRGGRVRIINCSPFVQTLLETVARPD